jgi:hypothetical protein
MSMDKHKETAGLGRGALLADDGNKASTTTVSVCRAININIQGTGFANNV